jgi:PIN domain nuclease of toxin-antitoxin system
LNSVLLDTSFLISLSDPHRQHHAAAKQYYKECITRQVPMFLSTVVISEYSVRQSINDLPLRNFIVLPFNVDHAMACGLLIRNAGRDPGDDRVRVKDDFKLMAQCQCDGITHVLSEDAGELTKYLHRLREAGSLLARTVLLKDGFDTSWFDNGQVSLLSPP